MIISLDKLHRKETDKIDLNFSQKIDTINYCENTYKIASPLNLIGKISRNNKGYYIDADVSFEMIDNCARCLDEVKVPIEYAIEGFLVKADFDEDEFDHRGRHSVIWQMLVEMFGDCGTSPRFGWIEKRKECAEFLREIMNAQYIN